MFMMMEKTASPRPSRTRTSTMTVVGRGTYCGLIRKVMTESVHMLHPEFLHQSPKPSRGRMFARRPSSNRSSFMMRMTTLVCCILFQRQLLYRQQQHFFVGASYTIEIGPNSEECFIFRTPTTIPKGAPSVLMYVVPTAARVVSAGDAAATVLSR